VAGVDSAGVARRDEIIAFTDELLDIGSYPDYGPMGMQVIGSAEVSKIVCGVSSSRELFERAAATGAQLVLVHHGLLWENEPRTIDARMKGRLKALFDADITLAAYHLALDANLEVGNNALLAKEIGLAVESQFADVGVGGVFTEPPTIDELSSAAERAVGRKPLVFGFGPERIERAAVVTGGAQSLLVRAANEGYHVLITGEAGEPTMMSAKELGVHFIAAGHYATERLGVQALARRIAERFGVEWEFVELANPV
jgi:dinuclear metal center YbgI/SA1388 family protein